jgi:uncharacterized membrane protein YdjX (TVP38/TMEM64 family)
MTENYHDSNSPSLANIHRCPMFNDQNLVENILDEDKEKEKLKEIANTKKAKKWTGRDYLQFTLFVVLTIFVLTITYLESKNLTAYIKWISNKVEYFVNNDSVYSYMFFFGFQVAFHLLFLPGLTFFDVLLGFYMKNTLKAFLVVYSTSVVSCMMTYYVARFLFKDYFEKTIFKKDLFNHMLELSEKSPWKASIVTRYSLVS